MNQTLVDKSFCSSDDPKGTAAPNPKQSDKPGNQAKIHHDLSDLAIDDVEDNECSKIDNDQPYPSIF